MDKSYNKTIIKSAMILIAILLLILGLLFSIQIPKITAEAAITITEPDSNGLSYRIDDYYNTCTVYSCLPTVTSLTIPKTYGSRPVQGFYNLYVLDDVNGLKHITIPSSVADAVDFSGIGLEVTFRKNSLLESITITETDANSKYYSVDGVLYKNKDGVKSLVCYPARKFGKTYTVSADITQIASYAFSNNYYLEEINLPSGLNVSPYEAYQPHINERPFGNCRVLEAVNIASNATNFASSDGVLFNKNMSVLLYYPANKPHGTLVSQLLANQDIAIGPYAFDGNNYLTSVDLSARTSLRRGAFMDCDKLKEVILPNSINELEDFLFAGCTLINKIVLPDNLLKINSAVFKGTSISHITIPSSVTNILGMAGGAFEDCKNLTAITFRRNTPTTLQQTYVFRDSPILTDPNAKIFVPSGSVDTYKAANIWKEPGIKEKIFADPTADMTLTLNYGTFLGFNVYSDNKISLKEPVRKGYEFTGWSGTGLSGSNNKHVFFDVTNIEPKSYTANWRYNTYNITYNMDGGDNYPQNPSTYRGNANYIINNPTKEGYTFAGWSGTDLVGENNKPVTIPAGSEGHREYTAHWTPSTNTAYTIEYYLQDLDGVNYIRAGTYTEYLEGTTGEVAYISNYMNRYTGFTYTDTNSELSGTILANGSLVLKAYYNRNSYTITFNSRGGSTVDAKTQRYYTQVSPPTPPTRTGYTFGGWYTDNGTFEDNYIFDRMPAENITLYAKWNANTDTSYTIIYYLQNLTGDYQENTDTSRKGTTGEMAYITNYLDQYTGYQYISTGSILSGEIKGDGSLILKAYYNRRKYNLKFMNEGVQYGEVQQVTYGATITYIPETTPTKPQDAQYTYMFAGWYPNPVGNPMQANEVKVNATYTPTIRKYDVRFLTEDGGSAIGDTQKVEYGKGAKAPIDPIKTGYTFKAWAPDFSSIVTDTDVIATYTINQYTITFNSRGGTAVEEKTQNYNTTVTSPTEPTRTGYVFGGWYTDNETFSSLYMFSTMPAENITLYAKWTANTTTKYTEEYYK